MIINDNSKIGSIQEEFNSMFPYLKLEFFTKSINSSGISTNKMIKNAGRTLGECRTIQNSGVVTITPEMTVADLENNFRSVYGLSVQLFRKSGKGWLETSFTESWSLEEQNSQGESLSKIAS